MTKIQIINGPNLNMLGSREPEVYGADSLSEIQKYTEAKLKDFKVELDWFQSNSETEIVEKIHSLGSSYKALIINPGAYSHTSVAILDALRMLTMPIIEVHLSNIYKREPFRQTMLTAKASKVIMNGLGKDAYYMAVYSQLTAE